MSKKKKPCVWCFFARDRTDVAGVYCTEGFSNADGTCKYFKDYAEVKHERNSRCRKAQGTTSTPSSS